MNKSAIIVAALFCCGKTYMTANSTKYKIIDLDAMLNPKQYNKPCTYEHKYKTPDYIPHIRKYLHCYDFIFIGIKDYVLNSLRNESIDYVLVYPEASLATKNEWEIRNHIRGTDWLWRDQKNSFFSKIKSLREDTYAKSKYELHANQYIADIIDTIYNENKV